MRHLFHRRTDERSQTLPFRLANDSQAATKIARFIHDRIVGKRSANVRQRMIKREIMSDHTSDWRGELPRARHREGSALHFALQKIAVLLDINGVVRNGSHKSF